jgi:hypothetical protein
VATKTTLDNLPNALATHPKPNSDSFGMAAKANGHEHLQGADDG